MSAAAERQVVRARNTHVDDLNPKSNGRFTHMRILASALIVVLIAVPAGAIEKEGEILTKFRFDLMRYTTELLGLVPAAKTCEDIMAI